MARKNSVSKPKEKVVVGKVSVACWENRARNGELFDCFSISKTVLQRNSENRSEFTGKVFSLNGLTRTDLTSIRQALDEIEAKLVLEERD